MSEMQNILRTLIAEFETLRGEYKDSLKKWNIHVSIQDSCADILAVKLHLQLPNTEITHLKTNCIAWQRKVDGFLAQTDSSRYYETFLTLTSPDSSKSLYNLLSGKSPWAFADWNFRIQKTKNTYTLQIIKSGVPLKLADYNRTEGYSHQELINQIEKLINIRVKEQLLASLEALCGDIIAILRTYNSAEAITQLIETYRIRSQGELLQQMHEQGRSYLNENEPPESKRRIICFIIRFLLEQELKKRYKTKIGPLERSKLVKDLIKVLNQKRILTDRQKSTFDDINQLCNQAIHETLPVPLVDIKEAFDTIESFIWG